MDDTALNPYKGNIKVKEVLRVQEFSWIMKSNEALAYSCGLLSDSDWKIFNKLKIIKDKVKSFDDLDDILLDAQLNEEELLYCLILSEMLSLRQLLKGILLNRIFKLVFKKLYEPTFK